jgi:predicted component of type VI protein secretion system
MNRNTLFAVALVALAITSACSSAKTEVLPPTVSVSIGQQLIDLKKAKDAGALSDKEYQAQVRRVIDSVR